MQRYGGNTSCVVIDGPGHPPIICDLGTGLRYFGRDVAEVSTFEGVALVTHLHWDHIQGIPFFAPALTAGATLDIYAPATTCGGEDLSATEAVRSFMRPPYFPVEIDALPGEIRLHSVEPGTLQLGAAEVRVAEIPHCGRTFGFRITSGGFSVGYVPDHQQPGADTTEVDPAVVDLLAGVDLLIHDAQFTPDEFAARRDWGHCTIDYAVEVAARVGARRLALFHHDPSHDDDTIDRLAAAAAEIGRQRGLVEVVAAFEGLTMNLDDSVVVDLASPDVPNGTTSDGKMGAPPVAMVVESSPS